MGWGQGCGRFWSGTSPAQASEHKSEDTGGRDKATTCTGGSEQKAKQKPSDYDDQGFLEGKHETSGQVRGAPSERHEQWRIFIVNPLTH